MSALVLDLGNTRWKMALAEGGELAEVGDGEYGDPDGLQAALAARRDQVRSVLVGSVVAAAGARAVLVAVERTLALTPRRLVSTDTMPNMVSGYRKPEQLGIDRLLAMVAARARTKRPCCVVDAGTAITLDFVDGTGRHLGGFILPGLRMSRECLLANTAIPRDSVVDGRDDLGRDTPTAVALGARYAVAGIVERFTIGSAALFPGVLPETFVGGGDAEALLDLLPSPCHRLDHPVLRGLAVVAASGEG